MSKAAVALNASRDTTKTYVNSKPFRGRYFITIKPYNTITHKKEVRNIITGITTICETLRKASEAPGV